MNNRNSVGLCSNLYATIDPAVPADTFSIPNQGKLNIPFHMLVLQDSLKTGLRDLGMESILDAPLFREFCPTSDRNRQQSPDTWGNEKSLPTEEWRVFKTGRMGTDTVLYLLFFLNIME